MLRIKLALVVIGLVVGYMGYEEFVVSQKASTPAEEIELSAIDASAELPNNYLKIGSHIAVYPGCVYEYEMGKYETGEPANSTKVTKTYYPIIAEDHPFLVQLALLSERFGDEASIPDELWPEFKQFTVLVKTDRFNTIGSIPEGWGSSEIIEGLVINRIEGLSSEEEGLLRESFPQLDVDQVLILEEGRMPSPMTNSLGMIGGGALMSILGIVWLLGLAGRKKQPPQASQPPSLS